MTPEQRGAIKARLLLDALAVLPTVSCQLHLDQTELARREEEGQRLLRRVQEFDEQTLGGPTAQEGTNQS